MKLGPDIYCCRTCVTILQNVYYNLILLDSFCSFTTGLELFAAISVSTTLTVCLKSFSVVTRFWLTFKALKNTNTKCLYYICLSIESIASDLKRFGKYWSFHQ